MKLIKAMATVAGLTGVSRILGFVRDIAMAAFLGAGTIADAFLVALKLPNLFRRITAEGAFSVSFIPLYSGKLETDGNEAADQFASNAFAVMLLILVPFTLLALWAMPWIVYAIAPGFDADGERYTFAVEFARITFPYLLFMSLTALVGGVLNARDRFAPFAAAPILFNLCLIIALFCSPAMDTAGHALSYGVLAAGVAQLLWLLYAAKKSKFMLRLKVPRFDADIKQLFKLMGPGILGAGVMHINLFADMIIASMLAQGSISYLYYADRLNQLPLGMVGIAVGTALLPMLSKAVARDEKQEMNALFNRSLEVCFLLSLPAAFAFFAIAPELIGGLFQRGAFSADDTHMTALVLTAYALGMPAYVATKVFSSVFWAQKDTVTPVKISASITMVNVALSVVLSQYIGVLGIAIGTALAGWLQFALMHMRIKRMDGFGFDARFRKAFLGIGVSAIAMYAALKGIIYLLAGLQLSAIVTMVILVIFGGCVYGAGVLALKVINVKDFKRYFYKKA